MDISELAKQLDLPRLIEEESKENALELYMDGKINDEELEDYLRG